MNSYIIGEYPRITGTFKVNGVLTDPGTVTLKVRNPAGTITTYTYPADISKSSTGIYYYDLNLASAGKWFYRWEGTGAVKAASETSFMVATSAFY